MTRVLPAEDLAPTADRARACWDEAADAWDHFVESGLDHYRTELHGPALLEHCGQVAGLDVLDLGCGQGWFSRQLAARGAHVLAIDWSPRLIEHARRHEAREPRGPLLPELRAPRRDGAVSAWHRHKTRAPQPRADAAAPMQWSSASDRDSGDYQIPP